MATSLEVRSPFLDVEFAEFANKLPSRMKLKGFTRKYILKKSFQGRIPRKILFRKKKGFGVPLATWFKEELRPLLLDTFSPTQLSREGFFNARAIMTLLDDHFKGKKDNRKQIWTLLMFQMWKERFGRR